VNDTGSRAGTAVTNHYYVRFVPGADEDGIVRFVLNAVAVGILFKPRIDVRCRSWLPG